jgi:hypothetical protein
LPDCIPSKPDIAEVPRRVDRKTGAELVTRHFFPVSPRSLEAWPLPWLHVNGKAVCETAELFAVAQAKLDAALSSRGGKVPASEPNAEIVGPHGAAAGRTPAVGCPA